MEDFNKETMLYENSIADAEDTTQGFLKFIHNRLRVLEGLSDQQDMDYLAHLRIIIKEI